MSMHWPINRPVTHIHMPNSVPNGTHLCIRCCTQTKLRILCMLRLQIGALLGQEAPGNLGKNPLEGLPSRARPSGAVAHADLVDLTESPIALGPSSTSPAPGQSASRSRLDFLSPSSAHVQPAAATRPGGTARGPTTPAARSVFWPGRLQEIHASILYLSLLKTNW